jgi:hypothetical protein
MDWGAVLQHATSCPQHSLTLGQQLFLGMRTYGEIIFGIMFMPWVWAEIIRFVAPEFHERMLARVKEETR